MPRRSRACVVVPRFQRRVRAVLALIATGTVRRDPAAPTLSSLWQTGYGQAC
jgi:hypothetical protein